MTLSVYQWRVAIGSSSWHFFFFFFFFFFFSNERSLSENFVFLLIRDWFTLRWSVNVNLKKNMKRKTFPHFFVCFTTPPGVAKFMEKFQSYWKVKIIIIICDDEHNPSFLNDDDYFQMMSWRSSFCDLQNFLRQPFFFFKRNNWKQFTSKRWKSMAFWVWITIHLHHCVEYLKKKRTFISISFLYITYIFFVSTFVVSYVILYYQPPPPFWFLHWQFQPLRPICDVSRNRSQLVLGRKVKVICFLSLSSIVKGEPNILELGAVVLSWVHLNIFWLSELPVVSLYI